jgi:uncharacterized phage protein (predicted DNA packaging)
MKVSKITLSEIKSYLNISHDEDDTLLATILSAAKSFVANYTGLTADRLDSSEDLSIAVFILSAELYDNRAYNIDATTKINPVISALLNMHSVNLL